MDGCQTPRTLVFLFKRIPSQGATPDQGFSGELGAAYLNSFRFVYMTLQAFLVDRYNLFYQHDYSEKNTSF